MALNTESTYPVLRMSGRRSPFCFQRRTAAMYRILIADDEILMRKGLCTLIDWQKFDCQIVGTAENGLQAKQAVIDLQPDILIADIKMPVLDGLELAQWIHTSQLQVQIILLTAFADFSYAQHSVWR